MITRKPKTAKEYHYYHRLFYGRIVKEMEKGAALDNKLKRKVWKTLFSFRGMYNHCFACAFSIVPDIDSTCAKICLLKFNPDTWACLGGLYDTATGISDDRIEAAREIRDLPMQDKWK